ncbi:MAG: hypothetical protein DPW14_14945 [Planctomycetes bacterium]|nr:hypothetical protein [Planctomycetota bacterium]
MLALVRLTLPPAPPEPVPSAAPPRALKDPADNKMSPNCVLTWMSPPGRPLDIMAALAAPPRLSMVPVSTKDESEKSETPPPSRVAAPEALMEPVTGDPEAPLRAVTMLPSIRMG